MAYTAGPRVLFAAERTGVALNIVIAVVALVFAARLLWPNQ
ncbi:MAG: hypothetical protein QOF32_1434 [Gammaproteobacteria bacterium]|jgi:hypothetical protein|nr:hypothetical protein [Gammaproteobacteria bacterium]